ncbi:MAG: acyl carrier protein [Bacteroidales bacterium]|nr:acyl carrier protein [Bacteroidales bacterium]
MEIGDFILKLEQEISDLPKGKLQPDTRFSDYPDLWDSLNVVLFIAFAKTEYDVDIETEEIEKVKTVKELFELVQTKAKK